MDSFLIAMLQASPALLHDVCRAYPLTALGRKLRARLTLADMLAL